MPPPSHPLEPPLTAEQNHPGSVASYDTRPGNEVGLFYNTPESTRRTDVNFCERIDRKNTYDIAQVQTIRNHARPIVV